MRHISVMKRTAPLKATAAPVKPAAGRAATRILVEVPRAPYAPTHASRAEIRKAVRAVVAARS